MKTSYYNIYVKNKTKNVICFNTKLDSFCLLSNEDAELLKSDVQQLAQHSPNIYQAMVNKGFIIADEQDEYNDLCKEYDMTINNNRMYNLTILPSLDCNLRCWYCYEKHIKDSHLTKETSASILKFVENIFKENPELDHLNVDMFGGEPLLFFETELYPLLKSIKEHVESLEKTVSFFFVTNAVCISTKNIPLFEDLKASFQISIDGYKDRHDKVKYIPETNAGTYDQVIQTIHELTARENNIYINLRINYDDETLPHMQDLINDLQEIDRHKIGVHLERVWQTGNFAHYDNEELKSIINSWMLNGFNVSYMNLSRRSYSCKASMKNQTIISYDGSTYKCTGRDFTPNHQDGTLGTNGKIHWDESKLATRLNIKTYDNHMCRTCKLLPLCWGPCCQKQMESAENDLARYCQKQTMEMSIADYIRYRFNNEYISNQMKEE